MMVKIYYHTHKGNEKIVNVSNLNEALETIENLYKARIKARAFEGKIEVGAVWKLDGKLTWYCELPKE